MEKGIALALEESGISKEVRCSSCSCQSYRSRTNHRAQRQVGADEFAGSRHHEACRRSRILIEIGEHQSIPAVDRWRVSSLIIPNLEMGHFCPPDTGNNSQGEKAAAFEA